MIGLFFEVCDFESVALRATLSHPTSAEWPNVLGSSINALMDDALTNPVVQNSVSYGDATSIWILSARA